MSLKLLGQCLTSTGTPTAIAATHNHSTADITLCVAGTSSTEVVVASSSSSSMTRAARVKGAEGATALSAFGSDAFLVCLPNGAIQLVRVGGGGGDGDDAASAILSTRSTAIGATPVKGAHFGCLASSGSTSAASLSGGGSNASSSSSSSAFTFAASRDALFSVDVATSTVTPLGRLAGVAGLPITSLTVVPESPSLLIAAVHNRLVQIDTRCASSSPSSVGVACPQRSWLVPNAPTTSTAGTRVTAVSVSGTWLSVGTSDGRMCLWDVRGSPVGTTHSGPSTVVGGGNANTNNATPTDVVEVVPAITPAVRSSSIASNNAIAMIGGKSSQQQQQTFTSAFLPLPAALYGAAASPCAVTSCALVGAGTVFTTDARGYARVWLRPNPSLAFESVVLAPVNAVSAAGGQTAVAAPSIRCGAVGSRLGGNLFFSAVDDLGIVSIFGEQL